MLIKKITMILCAITNVLILASDNQPKVDDFLTFDDAMQAIEKVNQNPFSLNGFYFEKLSKASLEKIVECVNNFDKCDHIGLLETVDHGHKNYKKHIANMQTHFPDISQDKEKKFDYYHKDMITNDLYNELKEIANMAGIDEADRVVNFFTLSCFVYLQGYLNGKKQSKDMF